MQYTTNFSLKKPQYADEADIEIINDNSDDIDTLIHQNRTMIAPAFDSTKAYVVGDPVCYLGELFVFIADKTAGTWDATKVEPTTAAEMGGGTKVVANPSGSATAELTKIDIGGTKYNTNDATARTQLNAMKTGFDGVEYDSPEEMVTSCDQILQDQIDDTNEILENYEEDIETSLIDETISSSATSTLNVYYPENIIAGKTYKLVLHINNIKLSSSGQITVTTSTRNTSGYDVDTIYSGTGQTGDTITSSITATANASYLRVILQISSSSTTTNVDVDLYEVGHYSYKANADARILANTNRLNELLSNVNKAANITWTTGQYLRRGNEQTAVLTASDSYACVELTLNAGDMIHYESSKGMGAVACILAEKYVIGNNTTYRPLSPFTFLNTFDYVIEQDMTVVISKRNTGTTNLYIYDSEIFADVVSVLENKHIRFPADEIVPKLVALSAQPIDGATKGDVPLCLLHFSDIHGNVSSAYGIKDFLDRYGMYVSDAICTGDMTPSYFGNYVPIFAQSDFQNILLAIGNHDVYANAEYTSNVTNLEKYNQYFAPSISHWNVAQPTDAATYGYCYYYKDYTNVRLIVLDAMAFDNTQYDWLEDALDTDKTVVIADHFCPTSSKMDRTKFDTTFNAIMDGMDGSEGLNDLTCSKGSAMNLIDTFITNGGDFACWLCGHLHYGEVGVPVSHPNQIFIAVETASNNPVWSSVPRACNTKAEDLFNIVSIDTTQKLIKVARIGADIDDHMRHIGYMCLSYQTHSLVYSI